MFTKHSPLEIKAEPGGHVEGIAWSFSHAPDQVGDHILPAAFRHAERLPMKLEHTAVIGLWESIGVNEQGLYVGGDIDRSSKAGREAAAKAADGQLSGLSIGFAGQFQKSGRNRIFTEAELQEVSLTGRPANTGSRVMAVKALDQCQTIAEFEKSIKDALNISRRQARTIANQAWPLFHQDDPLDLAGILQSITLR